MPKVVCNLSSFGYAGEPAPAVQALCYMPRINHSEWVGFLVDTEASGTCLNGTYAYDLQGKMNPKTLSQSGGIGGNCEYFNEKALLIFRDDANSYLYRRIEIGIQKLLETQIKENPDLLRCPCLLGRDIIAKCKFVYNARQSDTVLHF